MAKSHQQLISQAQEYFGYLYGREIPPEDAEFFLKSLVDLYNSFYPNK